MRFRVFAQQRAGALPVLELSASAERLVAVPLHVAREGEVVVLRLGDATARVQRRDSTEEDWNDARAAEAAGKSAGMSALARRCETVWCVELEGSEAWGYGLVAVLASVALGPALPDDGSRLMGTRSALLELDARRRE